MIIKIGDLQFGGNSKYQIEPGISGLSCAEIRNGDGVYSGVDGGYMSSQLYGFRTIVFTGFYVGSSCEDADELRRNLVTSLRIRYLFPIFITTFSQRHYYTEGYVTDIKADIEGKRAGEFQLTIVCPDPYIYDGGDGTSTDSAWIEQPFYKVGSGGFKITYPTPVPWNAGQQFTAVVNNGTVQTYPIINLTGRLNNPTVRNMTTGDFVTISGSYNGTVLIDMKNRIITYNGGTIASNRSITSTWWSLQTGENKIILETTSTSDVDYGMIRYKQGYEGI